MVGSFLRSDRQCSSALGVGMLIRWQGHYDQDGSQPRWGLYSPLVHWVDALGNHNLANDYLNLLGSNGTFQ